MHRSVADILRQLKAEGLATDAADGPAREALRQEMDSHLPWFLRIAVGLGAWVATGFLLGFFLALFRFDDPFLRMVVGAGLVAAAVYLRHTSVSEFRKHAAVAGSLAGQGLIAAGVFEFTDSSRIAALVLLGLSLGLIRIFRDSLHRFLSTLAAAGSAYAAVLESRTVPGFEIVTILIIVVAALIWRYRIASRGSGIGDMLHPVGYALIVALLGALLVDTFAGVDAVSSHVLRPAQLSRVTTIVLMLALAGLAWIIAEEHGSAGNRATFGAITGVLALGLATLSTPGIIAGAAVLALAFDRRDRVLLGVGVLFLLVFGSRYYYSLDLTLLEKSGVLAGSGLLLLTIRHGLARP